MALCSFCGEELAKGTGLMYVKKDAKVLWFCSRKCEKNMIQLKRKPRNITWTAEHRKAKQQALDAAAGKTKAKKEARAAAKKQPIKSAKAAAKTATKSAAKPAKK